MSLKSISQRILKDGTIFVILLPLVILLTLSERLTYLPLSIDSGISATAAIEAPDPDIGTESIVIDLIIVAILSCGIAVLVGMLLQGALALLTKMWQSLRQ